MMQFKILKKRDLVQGISDTSFGSIKPVPSKRKSGKRAVNFLKTISQEKFSAKDLVFAKQVFSPDVHLCLSGNSTKIIKNVDGLVSNIPGQILAITAGDCLPIFLFDPRNKAVGILHGGRECLIKGIIKNAIEKMVFNFNSQPKEILIGIGPHIRKCHYWLKEKTYQKLKRTKFRKYFLKKKKKIYFDLTKLAFEDLLKTGIKRKNIEDCGICTFCSSEKYFSARKEEESPGIYEEKNSMFAGFIGLKKNNISAEKAAGLIKKGKVIVCPTDTVYGLVCDATNKKAVEKLFKIKKRPKNKPVPIFIKDIKTAKKLAQIGKKEEKFLKKSWPGKVTVVLKKKETEKIYGAVKNTIALRIPNYKLINLLLKKTNLPLTGTSANISGKPASVKIKEVISQFQNQSLTKFGGGQPDLIIDAGNLKPSKPSKVIDLTGPKPKILRK